MWNFFASIFSNQGKQQEFLRAIVENDEAKIDEMIQKGLNVNFKLDEVPNIPHGSPLYVALNGRNPRIIASVLRAGATIPTPEQITTENFFYRGLAPLHWAIVEEYDELIAPLINAGVMISVPEIVSELAKDLTYCPVTPLHCTILKGRLDLMKQLIAAGADVNDCCSRNGEDKLLAAPTQPLHCAIFKGREDMVAELIKSGAKVNCRFVQSNGLSWKSALQLAKDLGHQSIVQLLERHGARMQVGPVEYDLGAILRRQVQPGAVVMEQQDLAPPVAGEIVPRFNNKKRKNPSTVSTAVLSASPRRKQ